MEETTTNRATKEIKNINNTIEDDEPTQTQP